MVRRRSAIYSMVIEVEKANKRAIAEQNRINRRIEGQRKALGRQNAKM